MGNLNNPFKRVTILHHFSYMHNKVIVGNPWPGQSPIHFDHGPIH